MHKSTIIPGYIYEGTTSKGHTTRRVVLSIDEARNRATYETVNLKPSEKSTIKLTSFAKWAQAKVRKSKRNLTHS